MSGARSWDEWYAESVPAKRQPPYEEERRIRPPMGVCEGHNCFRPPAHYGDRYCSGHLEGASKKHQRRKRL